MINAMKKIIFFHLWEIESLEKHLENMEQDGFRLENIKYSYCFYFKESKPKQMQYFLSYNSKVPSMGSCDYALESKHNANQIKSKLCSFTIYRTKEPKENLSFLYEVRLDYIKAKLFEKALTSLFVTILFLAISFATKITQSTSNGFWIINTVIAICGYLTVYYFYGYFKQRSKCKKYEDNKL